MLPPEKLRKYFKSREEELVITLGGSIRRIFGGSMATFFGRKHPKNWEEACEEAWEGF